MDIQNNTEDNDKEWWELWDRRRRMAVAQVLCYVSYAVCMCHVYSCSHEDDSDSLVEPEGKKRKIRSWEKEFGSIMEAINGVAEAIREGNSIIERTQARVYSEEEVFMELLNIGFEKHFRYTAYTFLVEDPARVRAFFGYPVDERKDLLLQMMYGHVEP